MVLEKIRSLCDEVGTNIAKLERDCGLANATIRRWDVNSPSAENLAKVADHLGVSVEYLLGRSIHGLSEEAQEYTKQFEALPKEKKQLMLAYLGVVQAM